ncbi:MAG: RagB/SusD family nutrient uptake outer membrane protein [Cyclobacteriaceae bacterium]|nr:RagB/SusD family nutrient uptake outer membrane protein [Cyclobacteriaceae bacterium]
MKHLVKHIFIGTLLLVFVACEVLEQDPISSLSSGNFFETAEHARSALTSTYAAFRNTLNGGQGNVRYSAWGDLRADLLTTDAGKNGSYDRLDDNEQNPTDPVADWSNLYQTIARANDVIANVPGIEDIDLTAENKSEILAEARFLRALSYFYLVRLWGDVPLSMEPVNSASDPVDLPRVSREVVLDTIEADISYALSRLPEAYSSNSDTRGRATLGAAYALQAHVYAWQANWEAAAASAQQVIQNPLYELLPSDRYADIFDAENTVESIFELQIDPFNAGEGTSALFIDFGTDEQNGGVTGELGVFLPSQKFLDNLEEGDLRRSVLVFDGEGRFRPQIVKYILPFSRTDLGTSVDNRTSEADNNIIIYRLADIILLRAESLNYLDRTEEATAL